MRRKKKLLWQLYWSYLLITLLSLVAMGLYATSALEDFAAHETTDELKSQAVLASETVRGLLSGDRPAELDTLVKKVGAEIATRITVVLASGRVVGDSAEEISRMDNHSARPEVREALKGRTGISERYSFTLNKRLMYVAVPVRENGTIVGVARTAKPVADLDRALGSVYVQLGLQGFIVALLAGALILYVSHRINRPMAQLHAASMKFAEGDLNFRVDIPHGQDFADLADAMNNMAAQLQDRIDAVTRQKNELEAVLSGMAEAVLVFDSQERLARINLAAERLFQIDPDRMKGRSVQEAIRNTELHRFVRKTFEGPGSAEGDITVMGNPDRFLQAHGTILWEGDHQKKGVIVVLNDVTRLKNLERIRRDFVSNVSHELKTPITSIKGYLETLKDGALDDPEDAHRFLDIIIKHTDRLSAIIEDLLSLSRIEQASEKTGITLVSGSVNDVVEAVAKSCEIRAEEKEIGLSVKCAKGLIAAINPTLLEQAVMNLVDNAVKYSEQGKAVEIEAQRVGTEIAIRVIDQGCGISKEHLSRIFERFYRVDKARSRNKGGTGLGLAIAKHIAEAHRGRIEVESSLGVGSVFSILIPAR